jgi:phage shock protein C
MTGRKFRLDRENGKLLGVCAGIANYFGWDPTFVRVGAVLVTLLGAFPWTLAAYGVAALVAKKHEDRDAREVQGPPRTSTFELGRSMRDLDRRMAEVEQYVTTQNSSLASEIESLR